MHSLVVGASRGLGLALTERLAASASGRVLAAARRPGGALENLRRRYPEVIEILELDVTDAWMKKNVTDAQTFWIFFWDRTRQKTGLQFSCAGAEDPESVSSAAARAKELLAESNGGLHLLCHTAGLLRRGSIHSMNGYSGYSAWKIWLKCVDLFKSSPGKTKTGE